MKRALTAVGGLFLLLWLVACQPEPPASQLYPYNYSGSMVTLDQLHTKETWRKANFEFARRVEALMKYAAVSGVPLGVGTCWRVQPTNGGPGFASPGNSNHEGFPADGVSGGAVACDMVPTSSWAWMNANEYRFCLRDFAHVNNEPWHIQPSEIPASRNYRREPWVLNACALPGTSVPPAPPAPPPAPNVPVYDPWHHLYGLWPVASKPPLWYGVGYAPGTTDEATRGAVTYFNHVAIFEAGQYIPEPYFVFGIHSIAALQNMQRVCGLPVTNNVQALDWQCIDAIAGP